MDKISDHAELSTTPLLSRFDLLTMVGAVLTLFVALGTEPWWTLKGAASSSLFTVQISPFFVHINAVGLPSMVPYAGILGEFTRTYLLLGFLALFAASIRPTAWWRNLFVYFGFSSLAELYLSFLLMFYWAETAFVNTYGIIPPYFGTSTLQATVIGLDLKYYTTPLVTATFNAYYYLGFISIGLILGRTLIKLLHERALEVLSTLLPSGGIHDIYLTPPYQHVWFSSGDENFNPLRTNPEGMNDDELLVLFEKLYDTVEPGGSLAIILPTSASNLTGRLEKLMPKTGFTVEKTGTIYRVQGKPENELRFRKPINQTTVAETTVAETTEPPVPETLEEATEIESSPSSAEPPVAVEPESPALLSPVEEPAWVFTRMTRLERSILKSAVNTITERQKPVPYRELLNQVYMDLVDHKIEFDSARQIEATLLTHNGRELLLLEEADDAGLPIVKKWWLGDQKMSPEKRHLLPTLEHVKDAKPTLPHLPRIFGRRKPRYTPNTDDQEPDSDSQGS